MRTPHREGCSRAPDDASSKDTDAILESMTYVGGMNYAKHRLKASRTKKARPAMSCMQDELGGRNAPSMRDGATSVASLRRSSIYRAVEEAAEARTAKLPAELEAQRALARLADSGAECNEQHKVVTVELEAMQNSVIGSLRANNKQQTAQSPNVDAMGCRLEEIKDLFLQR